MSLKNSLPDLYQNFFNSKILNLKVEETKATCNNCIQACDQRFPYLYKPDLKCCTFIPFLPNYAVGGILFEKLNGAHIIEKLIETKEFCLPLGLFPNFDYQFKFQNKKEKSFGNDANLLCHYYDKTQNQCSIWKYRGVVCTTFFCRSSYGKKGLNFWSEMTDYLSYVEMALAEDCLVMKDFSPRDVSDQLEFLNKKDFTLKEKTKKTLSEAELKSYWNGYTNPAGFYISCYLMIKTQTRASFKEIIGTQGLNLEKKVLDSYLCLSK